MTEVEKQIKRQADANVSRDKSYTDRLLADVRRRDGK